MNCPLRLAAATSLARGMHRVVVRVRGGVEVSGESFGDALAVAGGLLVVGDRFSAGAGRAYVFARDPQAGTRQPDLVGSDTPPGSLAEDDNFGGPVAISGSRSGRRGP